MNIETDNDGTDTDLTSRVLVREYSALVTREPAEAGAGGLRVPLHQHWAGDRAEAGGGGGGGCWRCTQGCDPQCDHQEQADRQLEKCHHPESCNGIMS